MSKWNYGEGRTAESSENGWMAFHGNREWFFYEKREHIENDLGWPRNATRVEDGPEQ